MALTDHAPIYRALHRGALCMLSRHYKAHARGKNTKQVKFPARRRGGCCDF